MKPSKRLGKVPPYLFAEIDRKKSAAIARGVDIINMGIGDPDLPTPPHIVEALKKAVDDPKTHNYPSYQGELDYRSAVAEWYQKRFNVTLDPQKEVLALIGSKEGIAHVFTAFVDPGDYVLVPDPGYPVYHMGTILAGGEPYSVPVSEKTNYFPDFGVIPLDVVRRSKILFLNYPNNPTGAVVGLKEMEAAVEFCRTHDLLLCWDAAYTENAYDGYKVHSILEIKDAKDVAIEFHSLSKTYNMTGWRVGMACGSATAVQALGTIKTNVDSGIFKAIQRAAIVALTAPQDCIAQSNKIYVERRNVLVEGLNSLGWKLTAPKATFYMWAPVPENFTSASFCAHLLDSCGIVAVPGNGYGAQGKGYFRMAITLPVERIHAAIGRMQAKDIRFQ